MLQNSENGLHNISREIKKGFVIFWKNLMAYISMFLTIFLIYISLTILTTSLSTKVKDIKNLFYINQCTIIVFFRECTIIVLKLC